MKHITLRNKKSENVVFNMGRFFEMLHQIPDPRKEKGKQYPLPYLLAVILLAKISGEHQPEGITEWIKLRRRQLVAAFDCPRHTAPSLTTITRTLEGTVSADELQRRFRRFLHQEYGGQQTVLVAIDGKTLRGTIPKGKTRGVHLLAAYLPAEGVVLMQVEVDRKDNEITAAPELLQQLDLRKRIVCGDAMFTQRKLSVQITAQGGDYIWFVKDNQKQLRTDVAQFFVPPRKAKGWHTPPLPQEVAQTTQKGHGRLEQRRLTLMSDEEAFINWPCLQQVFKLERQVTSSRTGKCTSEIVYGITSLSPEQANAQQMLDWTRAYWGIENGLHYRRDKTLEEDETRMGNTNQAKVIATFNNFIVGLVNKMGFSNLASAQRKFDAEVNMTLFNYL